MDIELVETCGACPEAYTAHLEGFQVATLRFRNGHFAVTCGETTVYERFFADGLQGIFANQPEREQELTKAKKAIAKFMLNNDELG